ncbi:MAG: arylsulfatase [Gammaproteobacteria bacterium]|nr:arylsulfatase [Gammaproteobacteria bacterium]
MKRYQNASRVLFALLVLAAGAAQAADKPNILVIFGDDVGMYNISAYHRGMMGGSTPNIDRIANEGALFTDYYAQQSCTAGRAAFITGQHPFRTGLLTIGMPGSDQGLQDQDPTLAELLKDQGYTSGQFGKNHLGDLDKYLPTSHGFDEFYGNLYHLNAEEEPETYHYPKDPEFHKRFGPRGVLHAYADGPIEDTGPLTRKRMETADEEFLAASVDFIERAAAADKPFFVWHNATRMHVWTHLSDEWEGKTGHGLYADGMAQHDNDVGTLLDKLDELGIADNTIVVYSTDNGAEKFTWPDGGTIPFRGEKGSTWEGGFRVPAAVRWPGTVKPGTIINDIFSHEDWVPTLMAAAGKPNIKEELKQGTRAAGKRFKTHLDGYDQTALLSGKGPGERNEIFYFDAGANLNAVRYRDWKIHFSIMEGSINEAYRKSPSWPLVINLRQDPFEVTPDSALYTRWYGDQMWLFVPAQAFVGEFLATFKEFPPSQAVGSLSVEKVLQALQTQGSRQ